MACAPLFFSAYLIIEETSQTR